MHLRSADVAPECRLLGRERTCRDAGNGLLVRWSALGIAQRPSWDRYERDSGAEGDYPPDLFDISYLGLARYLGAA